MVDGAVARYLDCGIFDHGFARLHGGGCRRDVLVAFTWKGRGLCPSTRSGCSRCSRGGTAGSPSTTRWWSSRRSRRGGAADLIRDARAGGPRSIRVFRKNDKTWCRNTFSAAPESTYATGTHLLRSGELVGWIV